MVYEKRIIDQTLDDLFPELPAIALQGPKGVGKTATAEQRAARVFRLDDAEDAELLAVAPRAILEAARPILIDEWQRIPSSWDLVRRAVDAKPTGGQFLLTGSSIPTDAPAHSGAGRIVDLRMRGLSIAERAIETSTVSFAGLFGGSAEVGGRTSVSLPEYVTEIVSSGFPAIRGLSPRARRVSLDGYLSRMLEHEVTERGVGTRQPDQLRRWLTSYARATASTAAYSVITERAGEADGGIAAPRSTVNRYRDVLTEFWMLDELPPTDIHLDRVRLGTTAKHFLADPALAARLMKLDEDRLLSGAAKQTMLGPQDHTTLGALFEALVIFSLNTYAQATDSRLTHLRTGDGDHEIDAIARRHDGRTVAFEVKLKGAPDGKDVRHLLWLKQRLGDDLADMVVVTAGQNAYRRPDGVAVVPLALLGA
ncbi:ATP-binding protein [Leifsonia sp. SIMBA_070]|uniref:ATP-binding protein n=1 Tax=Leifsonia sp. SIMBA_070 TaxID=3085810 RepID=UPI00397D9120